jgi:hypothetical protein
LTCRPSDYLPATALVPQGSAIHLDTDGGFTRAVDLLNPAEYSGAVCPRKSSYRGRSVRMGSAVLCGIQ